MPRKQKTKKVSAVVQPGVYVEETGLGKTELSTLRGYLISHQSGSCTKEQTFSRIIDLLERRQGVSIQVWENIKETAEFVGYIGLEPDYLVKHLKEMYKKRRYKA